MPEYVLLLHEDPSGFAELAPNEIQAVISEYVGWRERLASEGRLVGGTKLKDEGGRWLSQQNGQVSVVDGPFSGAKEIIGGFFIIQASGYTEAVQVSQSCPHIKYGGRIELREVDPVA